MGERDRGKEGRRDGGGGDRGREGGKRDGGKFSKNKAHLRATGSEYPQNF